MIDFYAYGNPGTYEKENNKDGSKTTLQEWKRYFDCGFNVMFLGGNNMWKDDCSVAKTCFDRAKELGVEKVLLRDARLYAEILGNKTAPVQTLFGENAPFKTEKHLDEYVEKCLSDYIGEKEFLGLSFMDEPNYESANAYGQLYRSVKKVAAKLGKPDIHIQIMIEGKHRVAWRSYAKGGTLDENYDKFFKAYTEGIGRIDFLGTDLYPFKLDDDGETPRFLDGYFSALKTFADYCKNNGVKFGFVLQSYELVGNYYPLATHRLYSINEMMLQINVALGVRADTIMFYTYEDFGSAEGTGYRAYGEGSLISCDGRKTEYYRWTKMAISYAKKVDKFIDGYSYDGCDLYVSPSAQSLKDVYFAYGFIGNEIEELSNVFADKHALFISKLKNKNDVCIMITNVFDDALCENLYEKANVSVQFKYVKEIEIFRNGVVEKMHIDNDMVVFTLIPGEAVVIKIIE